MFSADLVTAEAVDVVTDNGSKTEEYEFSEFETFGSRPASDPSDSRDFQNLWDLSQLLNRI